MFTKYTETVKVKSISTVYTSSGMMVIAILHFKRNRVKATIISYGDAQTTVIQKIQIWWI